MDTANSLGAGSPPKKNLGFIQRQFKKLNDNLAGFGATPAGEFAKNVGGAIIPSTSTAIQLMTLLSQGLNMYGNYHLGNAQTELMKELLKNTDQQENTQALSEQVQPINTGKGVVDNDNSLKLQVADMLNNKKLDTNKQLMILLQLMGGMKANTEPIQQQAPAK